MKFKLKDKRGRVLPRDILFIIITFSAIIAFSGIFVNQMALEYGNSNMSTSYNQDVIGSEMLEEKSERWEGIAKRLDGGLGSLLLGGLEVIGVILKEILLAPVTFSTMISTLFESIGIERTVGGGGIINIIEWLIAGILYGIIIFGIIKVFLRGGEV
jgi:hypothetical protein